MRAYSLIASLSVLSWFAPNSHAALSSRPGASQVLTPAASQIRSTLKAFFLGQATGRISIAVARDALLSLNQNERQGLAQEIQTLAVRKFAALAEEAKNPGTGLAAIERDYSLLSLVKDVLGPYFDDDQRQALEGSHQQMLAIRVARLESVERKIISQALPLTRLFGEGAIHTVFDVGIGDGGFLRQVQRQKWLAKRPRLLGMDLPADSAEQIHSSYRALHQGYRGLSVEKDWNGLTVVSGPDDEHYPRPGSVDLLHEAFAHIRYGGWTQRLNDLAALVRVGGWFMFAHSNDRHHYGIPMDNYTDWLKELGYPFGVYVVGHLPLDYPATFWWNYFVRHYGAEGNYLIVAQKSPKRP